MHFVEDYQRFGFRPAEIIGLLKTHEISIDLGDKVTGDDVKINPFPEWKRIMSLESSQSIHDLVCALIGVDPYETGFFPDNLQADYQRYEDLLRRAIARGELQGTESTTKRNEPTWQITLLAFHAWCEAKGFDYPLPPPSHATHHTVAPIPDALKYPSPRWPWGDYTTKALELLADTAMQWWTTYDPEQPSTAPTKQQIVDYLASKGATGNQADAIALILRADDLQTGRRKARPD